MLVSSTRRQLIQHDIVLIGSMLVLAACGLIYEYLLAHYAGRIIGAVETTIYAMIGIMIVSMGIGAFAAKWIKNPFEGMAWLELLIGFLGSVAVLIMASMMALSYTLPHWLSDMYGLHSSVYTQGGLVDSLKTTAHFTPFVIGFVLGFMIGMEIPLIARVREHIHQKHLENNTGTIYGADYIGAGIGAAIWVFVCLKLPIMTAAVATASANLIVGLIFLKYYQSEMKRKRLLWSSNLFMALVIVILGYSGSNWVEKMNYTLFEDTPVFTKVTPYQHITVTERIIGHGLPKVTSLYINGRLQFSSNDEHVYHSYLTYPAMLASAKHDDILVIGGGDGLAVRDILNWSPKSITLIDLDLDMVEIFQGISQDLPPELAQTLVSLNNNALNDKKVNIIFGDAFIEIGKLVSQKKSFDTIIVDLPDPSHPNLNKLYSDMFYSRLKDVLNGDGAIAVQSTSPYHAKKAFISVGKTLSSVGLNTQQYHTNVSTFGDWGWSIATKYGRSAEERIQMAENLPVEDPLISKRSILASFVFMPNFYRGADQVNVNSIGTNTIYQYHQEAWSNLDGVFFSNPESSGNGASVGAN